eukprot:1156850-Pelagomonas_calceolata.AAC.9
MVLLRWHCPTNSTKLQHTLGTADSRRDSYKGKRPQSRRLTASLFISTHGIMKERKKDCASQVQQCALRIDSQTSAELMCHQIRSEGSAGQDESSISFLQWQDRYHYSVSNRMFTDAEAFQGLLASANGSPTPRLCYMT